MVVIACDVTGDVETPQMKSGRKLAIEGSSDAGMIEPPVTDRLLSAAYAIKVRAVALIIRPNEKALLRYIKNYRRTNAIN